MVAGSSMKCDKRSKMMPEIIPDWTNKLFFGDNSRKPKTIKKAQQNNQGRGDEGRDAV
jgi:hypothetical protein